MMFHIFFSLLTIAEAKLVFVIVIHRHGLQTPEYVYPKDPYQASYWKEGLGALTNKGKQEMYDLGLLMRDRYSHFLPSKYKASDIHVEASERSITLESAYFSLAALYKPTGDNVWSDVTNWQPIPVYSISKSLDNKIQNTRSCTRYDQLLKIAFETEMDERRKKIAEEVLKNLTEHTGLDLHYNYEDLKKAAYVADALFVEKSNNLTLPDWTKDFYPDDAISFRHFMLFMFPVINAEMARFRCGPLVKEIIELFEAKIKGNITEKWWQYSGHESTIFNAVTCLNNYDYKVPVFVNALFLELHQNSNNTYEVAVVWRKNETVMESRPVPGCTFCPFEKFKEILKDLYHIVPNNWDEECKLDVEKFKFVNGTFMDLHRNEANHVSPFSFMLIFSLFAQVFLAKIFEHAN